MILIFTADKCDSYFSQRDWKAFSVWKNSFLSKIFKKFQLSKLFFFSGKEEVVVKKEEVLSVTLTLDAINLSMQSAMPVVIDHDKQTFALKWYFLLIHFQLKWYEIDILIVI